MLDIHHDLEPMPYGYLSLSLGNSIELQSFYRGKLPQCTFILICKVCIIELK